MYLSRLLSGLVTLDERWIAVSKGGRLLTPAEALLSRSPGTASKLWDEYVGAPASCRGDCRLVHLPAFSGRAPCGIPYAVTLHDLAFLAGPDWFPAARRLYYRLVFPRVVRGAALVMADSRFTAAEAGRLLGIPPERTRVVPLSAGRRTGDADRFRSRTGIDGPFILSACTVEPRKNIRALLEAWSEIRAAADGTRLVLAGRWGWGDRTSFERLASAPGVVRLGEVGRGLLEDALAAARLLVYPSLYEGFGLPPLEAASAGVPSVIGPARSLSEYFSGIAAATCGADPASIASAVIRALSMDVDREGLKEFAASFDDLTMAGRVAACYREVDR